MIAEGDFRKLKQACFQIVSGTESGTGYLVHARYLVTCYHVVKEHIESGVDLQVYIESNVKQARVVQHNQVTDCALVKLDAPCTGVECLILSPTLGSYRKEWVSFGYPAIKDWEGDTLRGVVEDSRGTDGDGVEALVLSSNDIGAGQGARIQGFSGAPVMVDGYVVGHLRKSLPGSGKNMKQGEMRRAFATKAQHVQWLLELEQLISPRKVFPPPVGYDPERYIHREAEEKQAIEYLNEPGKPVVLIAPMLFGKSSLLGYLLEYCRQEFDGAKIIHLNLQDLGLEIPNSIDELFKGLAVQIVQEIEGNLSSISQLWGDPLLTLPFKMEELMKNHVFPENPYLLLLVFEQAQCLWDWPDSLKKSFLNLLRSWVGKQRAPWPRLRVFLCISTISALQTEEIVGSPFNQVLPIELGEFTDQQLRSLGLHYGMNLTDDHLRLLRQVVGGHPYLTSHVLYEAHRTGTALGTMLNLETVTSRLLNAHLNQYRELLRKKPGLLEELRRFRGGRPVAGTNTLLCLQLVAGGLLKEETPGVYRLCYSLFERLLD